MEKKKIFAIMTLGWMILIFLFSAQKAEESDYTSLSVGMIIGKICIPEFEQLDQTEQIWFAEQINYPVRKCAHATEYGILALLFYGTYTGYGVRKAGRFSVLSAVFYAATDEFHQLFVPGRSGDIKDVCIDGTGAICAVLLCKLVIYLHQRRRKNL